MKDKRILDFQLSSRAKNALKIAGIHSYNELEIELERGKLKNVGAKTLNELREHMKLQSEDESYFSTIESLPLSKRSLNALRYAGIFTTEQLKE